MTGFPDDGQHLIGHRIDQGRLELVAVLGFGAYGVVYEGVDVTIRSGKLRRFAVKCLIKAGLDTRQRQFQRREIALHQIASAHKHVVSMHRMLEEGEFIFVILDYCSDGDLFGMITEQQRYVGNDALIKRVFLQIIDAVDYCHSLGIYHRDLKPENIMAANGGESVYLGDFGLATTEKVSRDFGCGSTFYMSPECQGGLGRRGPGYSTRANDTWSLGVILVNLTCGRNPWRQATLDDETFSAFARDPSFLRTILPISRGLAQILQRIFTLEAGDRITLGELRCLIHDVEVFTMSEAELRAIHGRPSHGDISQPVAAQLYPTLDATSHTAQVLPLQDSSPLIHYNIESPSTPPLMEARSCSGSSDASLPPTPDTAPSDNAAVALPIDAFNLDKQSKCAHVDRGGLPSVWLPTL